MKHQQQQQNLLHSMHSSQNLALLNAAKNSSLKNRPFSFGKQSRKSLSATKFAFYLLRFNVALQVAAVAILGNLILAIATFWYGLNALYCAFGMDCVIGVLTSAILVWRFASAKKSHLESGDDIYLLNQNHGAYTRQNLAASNKYEFLESVTIEQEDPQDHARELWSTFWLGQVMIISGVGVVVRTVVEIVSHLLAAYATSETTPKAEALYMVDSMDFGYDALVQHGSNETVSMEPLYWFALVSLCLNAVLMVLKLCIYHFLGSNSMLIEGINSLISALFAGVAMVSIRYSDSVQYLDQIVSIMFGVFLIAYGGYNMLHTVGETVYRMVKNSRPGYEAMV